MKASDQIRNFLRDRGVEVVGSIVEDPLRPKVYLVFVLVCRDSRNRQLPSNIRLNSLKSEAAQAGLQLEFLLSDAHAGDVEAGLRATLLHGFGSHIRNVFVTVGGGGAHIWLDQKSEIDEETRGRVRASASAFLASVGLEALSVSSLAGQDIPTKVAILRAIRQLAPVDRNHLARHLEGRGHSVPSLDWLRRRLDVFRKDRDVVWLQGDLYALTAEALVRLGTAKGRRSPDISRLLALAWSRG